MEGKVTLLLVVVAAALVGTSLGSVYRPVKPYPTKKYCPFKYITTDVHQKLLVHGYKDYKQCRARLTINTCSGTCKPGHNYYYKPKVCNCCKPYGTRWVSKWVTFDCGYKVYHKTQWYVLEPVSCQCTSCY